MKLWYDDDLHCILRHEAFGPALWQSDQDGIKPIVAYSRNKIGLTMIEEQKHGRALLSIGEKNLHACEKILERADLKKGTIPAFQNFYCYYKTNGELLNANDSRTDLIYLDHCEHFIVCLNSEAGSYVGRQFSWMTEKQWCKLQYEIAGLEMPNDLDLYDELKFTYLYKKANQYIEKENKKKKTKKKEK